MASKQSRRRMDRVVGRGGRAAAHLAAAAGASPAMMEELEQRKLLAITIGSGDVNPATGLGTVSGYFDYFVPRLFWQLPADQPQQPVIEEFADENDPWAAVARPPGSIPPSGTFFSQSEIQIAYTSTGVVPELEPAAGLGGGQGPGDPQGDRDLRIALSGNGAVTFAFFSGVQEGNPRLRLTQSSSFVIGLSILLPSDTTGLDTSATGTKVELLRQGQVVAVFSGAALAALGTPVIGFAGDTRFDFNFAAGYDSVRFSSAQPAPDNASYTDNFRIDDVTVRFPSTRFAQFVDDQRFSVVYSLTGPVGASMTVLDLYGREMIYNQFLGIPEGADLPVGDPLGTGIPSTNLGIGQVILSGFNLSSSVTLIGAQHDDEEEGPVLPDNPAGFLDDFEQMGFGYALTNAQPPQVIGLPPASGSLLIGSPIVPDISTPQNYFRLPGLPPPDAFVRGDQGFRVTGNLGVLTVHGIVHGSSTFGGAVGRYSASVLLGSTTVQGDVGSVFVAGEAGLWQRDDNLPAVQAPRALRNGTGAIFTVGRTLGQMIIGGRSMMNVNVLGDVNNTARPRVDRYNYAEQEFVYADVDPAIQDGPRVTLGRVLFGPVGAQPAPGNTPSFMGEDYFRNDTILGAEWIGGVSSGVRLTGTLGNFDPVNTESDSTDVFAFAADGSTDVNILVDNFGLQNFDQFLVRVVDIDGRVLASNQYIDPQGRQSIIGGLLSFRPDHADVFFLVFSTPNDDGFASNLTYQATITGLAPTNFGLYRTGGGNGGETANVVSLQSGAMGSAQVGVGYVGPDAEEADTFDVQNHNDNVDDNFNWRASTVSVAGHLFAALAGSDVNGARLTIGGRLGVFRTGLSEVVGTGPGEGDANVLDITVGSTIGLLDIRGAIAREQDDPPGPAGPVFIRTGTAGGRGDIGSILVGALVDAQTLGTQFTVRTSPGSVIDRFLVGVTGGDAGLNGDLTGTPVFNLGAGSDLRFADFGLIVSPSDADVVRNLVSGFPVTMTDDSGTTVRLEIVGGTPSFGTIRSLPISGSQGVAIARIDVTLNGGAVLRISGTGPGVASIGRINVTTTGPGSQVIIGGTAQVDVWRIDQLAGPALALIQNASPLGDIVAIDVQGLDRLIINTGSLGRTQTSGSGPTLLGPWLGVTVGYNNARSGPLGVLGSSLNPSFGGQNIAVPIPAPTAAPAESTLEDHGAPFDGYLNGMVVRAGSVTSVQVGGTIGDIILQGGALLSVVANADFVHNLPGAFEGIAGTLYAGSIGTVDIGDGLAAPGPSPFARAGIFADDDIQSVFGGRGLNPIIRGVISAANNGAGGGPFNGVDSVRLVNGRFDGAVITGSNLDAFWKSARYSGRGLDTDVAPGAIASLTGVNSDLFRSTLFAGGLGRVDLANGAWDATTLHVLGFAGSILAAEFRNTTRLGEVREAALNEIRVSQDLALLSTTGQAGDIADLYVEVRGTVTQGIIARNTARLELQVAGTIRDLSIGNDIRATTVNAGQVVRAFAGGDIRSTRFDIAGPIVNITANGSITSTVINSGGPDGRIDLVQARFYLTGEINSSGPINLITSTQGDVIATIRTTDSDGTLNRLNAGNDLLVTLDIQSHVNQIIAGRNIGALGDAAGARVLNLRGNLGSITATRGQIYTDLVVGQSITGFVRNARVAALPGNDLVSSASIRAFGRINLIDWNGDLNGSIISESGGIATVRITDGSFRPSARIESRDGGIESVTITGGHLMGQIISEWHIGSVRVLPNAAGFWGDIGVNPNLSQFAFFDPLRNQLPPGVAPVPTFQGARIQAGTNIGLVEVAKASMWESAIVAGHSISRVFIFGVILNDHITPGLGGSFIVAGDSIGTVEVNQFVGGAIILAGVKDLGADNRPGGTGANRDTVQFGRIGSLTFRGGTGLVTIGAGLDAGPDGVYTLNPGPDGIRGTPDDINDDSVADGISSIGSVTVFGQALQTTVYADNGIGFTSPGIIRGGPGLRQQNPGRVIEAPPATGLVPTGVATPFTTPAGETGRITFTGPGQVYYNVFFDPIQGRTIGQLAVINSTLASRLVVDTDQNSLTDFQILSNDGASLGYGSFRGNMNGASSFYFDGYVQYVEFGFLNTSGLIGAGNDIGTMVLGPVLKGTVFANYVNTIIEGGDFGLRDVAGEAVIDVLAVGSILIGGSHYGQVSSERDIGSVRINGEMNRATLRAGLSLSSLVVSGSIADSRVSVRDSLGPVWVGGSVVDSAIYAGADLGFDGQFGGTGASADVVTNGSIASVIIGGSFVRSDIAAGIARGADGFLGTDDDVADEGRSTIGPVSIAGSAIGSAIGSQSYRIISTGTLGAVTVGGQAFTGAGNLAVVALGATSLPVQVADLRVAWDAGVYTAILAFNQPIDASTLPAALRVSEIRAGGVELVLAPDADYTVAYDSASRSALVRFSALVTGRDLPVTPGLPGPGTYRFILQASVLRGQTQNALLDGNGDGFAAPGDDYSQDAIIGDAGDKLADATTVANGTTIDFRAPSDLTQVMDNNRVADGLPDADTPYTLRGVIGDHPDQDVNNFRTGGDVDLYRLTLLAGQVLRLGPMQGNALFAGRVLLDATGATLSGFGDPARRLASPTIRLDELTLPDHYLITRTGTYFIMVTPTPAAVNVADGSAVANLVAPPGTSGDYNFTVTVFDDGDTGFSGDSDSGDGARVVNAPTPIQFAGPDLTLGTADDLPSITIGSFVFTYSRGPDGRVGSPADLPAAADDIVSGSNGSGMFSQRTAGPDRLFGTPDDELVTFVSAAIGTPGAAGAGFTVEPDVDIFHLNNRDPIVPGTVVRVTVDLTELGSNLGLTTEPVVDGDLRGDVQFAIFDTSGSTGVGDALLVASSSDFKAVGGQPARTFSSTNAVYGYDADGNFFIQFVTLGRLGVAGNAPASYAVYLQGAVRSEYSLKIVTQGAVNPVTVSQNVLLETRGGTINWLEAGRGVTTSLLPYTTSGIGFTGLVGSQPVDNYVLNNLVSNLNAIFAAVNVNIILSTNPAAFQGQSFSTVFLTGSSEPAAFFANGSFGASQHTDPFNADPNDQAVVFIPSLGVLGNGPDQAGIDSMVLSLTAAVSRRIGELVGLRALENVGLGLLMASDSVSIVSPAGYTFSTVNQRLSSNFDSLYNSNFYLGQQNDAALLQRILSPRA
jgi:hypothetical protein